MTRMTLRSAITAIICSMSYAVGAYADPRPVDVPAGDLIVALESLAKQSGVEFVYQSDQLKGLRTHGVSGTLSPQDAVTKLLEGTSLTLKTDATGAMLIAVPRPNGAAKKAAPAAATTSMQSAGDSIRIVQADTAPRAPSNDQAMRRVQLDEVIVTIPEVLVVGSRSINADIQRTEDDAQPYVIFDRAVIERSGATNIEEFLKQRLPMNSTGITPSQGPSLVGSTSQINLRGLGTNQTLILIDGRRAASAMTTSGPIQSDLNGIPLAAVERIEVLPTTASGIYGGSATGGVINVVLRRDYSGLESKVTYDNTFHADSAIRRIDAAAGFNFDDGKTNVLFAGSWSDSEGLLVGDRDFLQRGRTAISANNPSFFLPPALPPLGATPNIRSANGSPLFGPGTPSFTSVPEGYAGGAGLSSLQANAGQYNLEPAPSATAGGSRSGLTNSPTIKSLTTTVRRKFGAEVDAFIELAGSDTTSHFPDSSLTGAYTIAAGAPNNPFGQAVQVRFPQSEGLDGETRVDNEDRRIVGGVIVGMPGGWKAEADYTWSRISFLRSQSDLPTNAASTAIGNGTLDVLRDTTLFPVDFAPYLAPIETTTFQSTFKNATLRLAGPVGTLPGGAPTLGLLVEHRDENFGEGSMPSLSNPTSTLLFPGKSQSINSAYLEANIPIFSDRNGVSGIRELDLQVAGRWDEYTVDAATNSVAVGPSTTISRVESTLTSINPTVGLRFRPVSDLMLRASYGTGFLPPSVQQLVPNPGSSLTTGGNDPRRDGTSTGVVRSFAGGSPDLEPEESESWSAGAVFTPRFAPGLRLSVDYSQITKRDNITQLTVQQILDNEALFPERVIRDPVPPGDPFGVGPVNAVDRTLLNIARAEVEAYDVQLDYRVDFATLGTLDFFSVATWQTHYKTQIDPTTPAVENAGITSSFPLKFKANGGLIWKYGNWTVGWNTRYFDSYQLTNPTQILNQGSSRIPDQIYHDAFATFQFNQKLLPSLLSTAEVQMGIRNVLDTKPPFDASATYFYSFFGDPRVMSYYVSIRTGF